MGFKRGIIAPLYAATASDGTPAEERIEGTTTIYDYGYDLRGRLSEVQVDSQMYSRYEYDGNGNRMARILSSDTLLGSHDGQDRLIQYGGFGISYNRNGDIARLISNGDTTQYIYDVLGNLISVQLPAGPIIEYVIDGRNRRVGKKVNGTLVKGFLYQDQLNPVAELDGSGNVVARFVYGSKANVPDLVIKQGITYRIVSDHLGSPRLVVNATSGAIVQRMNHDEFGNLIEDSNPEFQPFGFAGGIYDSHTSLVRFGARDFLPWVGRWTNKDPIRFSGGNNFYSYVHGDPINFSDPFGLIEYNAPPPRTEPLTGQTLENLECVEMCLSIETENPDLNLLITGGAEKSGHSKNSAHYTGNACDIAGSKFNPGLTSENVFDCASQCGFGAGHYEEFPDNPNRDHWHVQTDPGNGVPALPPLVGPEK